MRLKVRDLEGEERELDPYTEIRMMWYQGEGPAIRLEHGNLIEAHGHGQLILEVKVDDVWYQVAD